LDYPFSWEKEIKLVFVGGGEGDGVRHPVKLSGEGQSVQRGWCADRENQKEMEGAKERGGFLVGDSGLKKVWT